MADVHDRATRRRNMQAIRSKDTKPEVLVRKALFREGFRYSLHRKDLPGKPDLTLPKHRAVVQIHGCYWHFHGCHLSKIPDTDSEWWRDKLQTTRARDHRNRKFLAAEGWRVCEVWECALRGKNRRVLADIISQIKSWLNSDANYMEISGQEKE
ncbi:very short patch repair endonuclease [Marinobacter shengliensis]|uniref:very short patch repair endonuclease n=1 Tax=Marinobacter shengliensis TaxID=1389223 RepID=UPI00257328C1|nr:DNA mismatch endonuclease Vsr [Marinobacter shengliensis]BEH16586.1 very short patch repair endonuclease [Marinobacter shengliensis]